jgi:hypothetical protein
MYQGNSLCCDNCGQTGGVRKRTCPHKVLGDSLFSVVPGLRGELPYCSPAALCSRCYHAHKATLHAGCKEGAARQQAKADQIEEMLESGAYLRTAAWGEWHEKVPAGRVGVAFKNREGAKVYYHVAAHEYGAIGEPRRPMDYPSAMPMEAI